MFKLAGKLIVLTIVFTGISLFISDGKVSANHPEFCNDIDGKWGVNTGQSLHGMAGVKTKAQRADNNEKLNDIGYTLKSRLPDSPYGYPPTNDGQDKDARIFRWPLGSGRTDQQTFYTGKPIYYAPGENNYHTCKGWSVLGYGATGGSGTGHHYGNRWVLDCGEADRGPDGAAGNGDDVVRSTIFTLSNITKPSGQKGHWEVKVYLPLPGSSGNSYLASHISNFDTATGEQKRFGPLSNGDNVRIEMFWHQDTTTHTTESQGDCTYLDVLNGGHATRRSRILVEVYDISLGRQRNNNDPNTDKTYHDLEQEDRPGSVYAWVGTESGKPPENGLDPGASGQSKQWFFIPWDSSSIHVKVTHELLIGGSWQKQASTSSDRIIDCYKGHCTIEDVNGPGPNDIAIATQPITVHARIHNTSADNLPMWFPSIVGSGGKHEPGVVLAAGDSYPINFTVTAVNNITVQNLNWTPEYFAGQRIGPDCGVNVSVYKEFNLFPNAGSVTLRYGGADDEEDPDRAVFSSSVNNTAWNRADVSIPVTRTMTKNGSNYPPSPWTSSPTMGDVSFNDTAPISNSVLGDEYCGQISISPAWGWQGPGGAGDRVVLEHSRSNGPTCDNIVNRPYLRAYGADVVAGSAFEGDSCNPSPTDNIRTHTSIRNNKSGSGTQLAGIAMGTIEGFNTASLRNSPPQAKDGLSFGNDPPPGGYEGEPICFTDFYGDTQADEGDKKNVVSVGDLTPRSHPGYDQTLYDGDLVLNGTGVTPFNGKKIIYVNGNVRITGDISYAGFSDPTDAPSFMLVARGNIYIGNNVKRLDGLYVAQQKSDNTGGTIFTCAKPGEFEGYEDGSSTIFDNCGGPQGEGTVPGNKQLTVNGAFIAHGVKFHRVHKSVRDSRSNIQETPGVTQSSEIFNFSPEIYLSPPPFVSGTGVPPTQYYTTLPPIL